MTFYHRVDTELIADSQYSEQGKQVTRSWNRDDGYLFTELISSNTKPYVAML